MKVKEIMKAGELKFCTAETRLANAARIMKESNNGALPVLDENQKVIAMLTDRDISLSLADNGSRQPIQLSVKDILPKAELKSVKSEDEVEVALREMRLHKIGRLPVTDKEGKLKGVISVNTLLNKALEKGEGLGEISSGQENLARTLKALHDRNNNPAPVSQLEAEKELY